MKSRIMFLALGATLLVLVNCGGKGQRSEVVANNIPPAIASGFNMSQANSEKSGTTVGERRVRQGNTIVYHDGILIVGGGYMDKGVYRDRNDVLWSPDGREWRQLASNLISPERNSYATSVFQEKVAIVGGKDTLFDIVLPFVYRGDAFSIDPQTGEASSFVQDLPPRDLPALIVAKDRILVVGGLEHGGPVSTVFIVSNGKIVARSGISDVEGPGIGSCQGWSSTSAYYVSDGEGDFWKSADGIAWRKLQVDDRFKNRSGYVVIPRGPQWYLVGGKVRLGEDLSGLCNDVWKSSDEGKTWTLLTVQVHAESGYVPSKGAGAWGHYRSFPAREQAAGLLFQGRLVIGGGRDGNGDRQDFWVSDDGINWEELK